MQIQTNKKTPNKAAQSFTVPKATLSRKVAKCVGGVEPVVLENQMLGKEPKCHIEVTMLLQQLS